VEASLIHYYRAQGALLSDSAKRAGVDAADRRAKTAERLMTITYDEALRGSLMIGTPDTVTERLRALQRDMGLDGVLVELNCGGKVEHANEMEALRLLCEDVMPCFR
jgi:alkanesulfonate monooxygenase SsuD/methylene tetrahydromethanopterin reductase-like flavin-dependent oxidoreductase (luciferase family)